MKQILWQLSYSFQNFVLLSGLFCNSFNVLLLMSYYSSDNKVFKLTIMNMVMVGNFAISSDKLRFYTKSALK